MNKSLKKKVDKIVETALGHASYEIAYKFEKAYEEIIDKFYRDYEPEYYNRTKSLYMASNLYHDISSGVSSISNGYQITLSISSDNIIGEPYRANKDWVFDRAFVRGIHGFTEEESNSWKMYFNTIPSTPSFSPKSYLDDWYKHFKKGNEIKKIMHSSIEYSFKKNKVR